MASKRAPESQLTRDSVTEGDGLSVGAQMGGSQKATAAQMANRKLAALPKKGSHRAGARPPARPAAGMQQQQSFPSPFGQNDLFNTNGNQAQQSVTGFGQQPQQMQQPNGTQNTQASASFPPFGSNSNGNGNANTSFPPPSSSSFDFNNEKAQWITNPFSPGAEPPPNQQKGFLGDIFRVFPADPPKEIRERLQETGKMVPEFAPGAPGFSTRDIPPGYKFMNEGKNHKFQSGETVPQFAAHSPYHGNQQQNLPPNTVDMLPAFEILGPNVPPLTCGQSSSSVFSTLAPPQSFPSNFFGGSNEPKQTPVPNNPFEHNASPSQESQIAQPITNPFANMGPPQPSSKYFGQSAPPASEDQPSGTNQIHHTAAEHTAPASNIFNTPLFPPQPATNTTTNLFGHLGTPQPSFNFFGQAAAPTSQAQQLESITSPNDMTMMSTTPESSPQSRPFQFLNPSDATSKPPGGNIFGHLTQPGGASNANIQPSSGGSLFDRITPSNAVPNPQTPLGGSSKAIPESNNGTDTTSQPPSSNIFGHLTQPEGASTANIQPSNGGSLFDRVTPSNAVPNPETTLGGSSKTSPESNSGTGFFDKYLKSDAASATQSSDGLTKGDAPNPFANLRQKHNGPTGSSFPTKSDSSNPFSTLPIPDGSTALSRKGSSQVTGSASLTKSDSSNPFSTLPIPNGSIAPTEKGTRQVVASATHAEPADNIFGGLTKSMIPQPSSPAPSTKPITNPTPFVSNLSAEGTAHRSPASAPVQPPGSKPRTTLRSKDTYLACPVAPIEFSENEKRDLITGWRLKSLEAGLRGSLRKNPTDEVKERIRAFYEHRKKIIIAANGGPLDAPSAGDKPKPSHAKQELDLIKKKSNVNTPRKPLEAPTPAVKRGVPEDKSDNSDRSHDQAKKPRLVGKFPDVNGLDGHGRGGEPSSGSKAKTTNSDDSNILGKKPEDRALLEGPDIGNKRNPPDPDDWLSSPSKKARTRTNGIAPPGSQTASIFKDIIGTRSNGSNIFGDIGQKGPTRVEDDDTDDDDDDDEDDDERPPTGGLFDRITKDGNGNAVKDDVPLQHDPPPTLSLFFPSTTPQKSLPPPLTSGNGNAVKDNVPLQHDPSPTPSLFFPSTTPQKSLPPPLTSGNGNAVKDDVPLQHDPSPTPSLFFPSTTPQKSLPPPLSSQTDHTWKPTSPIQFGNSTSISASPAKPALGGLFGAATTGSGVDTPPKPVFNFLSPSPTKTPSVGFSFTPVNAASNSLVPPSNADSATTSRATSPGATTGESANESNTEEDDGIPKDAQLNLTAGGPGEEDEDTAFEVKAKAMVFDAAKKAWATKGVGPFRILKHKRTGKARMLMRQDPSGKILLNSALSSQLKYEKAQGKAVRIPVVDVQGRIETWTIKTGREDDADMLARLLEELKLA